MDEKKFLKTAERVRDILIADPYSREDDIYLTWRFWKTLFPDIEKIDIKQFKYLFLSGFFGLPASVTRARALIQNKTNPELRGLFSEKLRAKRGEVWRKWFASNRGTPLNEDNELIRAEIETEGSLINGAALFRIPERGEIAETGIDQDFPEKIDISTKDGGKMKMNDKIKVTGEKYYSLGEYVTNFCPGEVIDIELAKRINNRAAELNKENQVAAKYKSGAGIREGLLVEIFRYSILKQAIKDILNP